MKNMLLLLLIPCVLQAQVTSARFRKSNDKLVPNVNLALNKDLQTWQERKLDSTNTKSSDTSFVYLANQVVVTAHRYKANLFDIPDHISTVQKEQIEKFAPISTPDLVSNIPSVWMQKTNHGGGSPYIRGLTGYQTLLVLDGIRLNNSIFRSGPNQYLNTIDPYTIELIEVLHGHGAVQYGSDGIGGTLQVFSRSLNFSDAGLKVTGQALTKFMSREMEKTGRAEICASSKYFALQAGFTHKDYGNIYAGGHLGELPNTGYNEYSWDFKSRIKLAEKHELSFLYQNVSQHNIPLYHQLLTGKYITNKTTLQQRNMAYARLTSHYNKKWLDEIKYTTSFQSGEEVRNTQSIGSITKREEIDKIETIGISAEILSSPFSYWSISSGIEFYNDAIQSHATNTDTQTNEQSTSRGLYPNNSKYRSAGIFSLHKFTYNRFILSAGLRFNAFVLEVNDETIGNTTIRPSALVGNTGLVYKLSKSIHLVTTVGTGFRSPNINDVASLGIADFRYEVPNYQLAPEKSTQYQAGLKVNAKRNSFTLYFYQNNITDLITNQPSNYQGLDSLDGRRVYQRYNSDKAIVKGMELEMQHELSSKVKVDGSLTYTIGDNTSRQEPLSRIPPIFGRVSVHYQFRAITAMMDFVAAGRQNRLSDGDKSDSRIAIGGTPNWFVTNVRMQYSFKSVSLYGSVLNILNEAYRVHGSGVDGIGRSYSLSVSFSF